MKYKEEIQVITTVNEFLRFHTNPSNQHHANYHEIRSHMRRFRNRLIIRIYAGAPNLTQRQFSIKYLFGEAKIA